ncbi:MAG: T9SS type A sorting domain-containing protein [Bacteroidetes bacterium]|nr:T9SS type A sorting domain-containing protein [Bacteroidota bacterium]
MIAYGPGSARAQCTYTSVQAGDWNTASTWTCTGCGTCSTPSGTNIVIINHDVTMGSNITLSGDLTINSGGSLSHTGNRTLTFNGTTFNLHGTATLENMALGSASTLNIYGTLTLNRNHTNSGTIHVHGDFTVNGSYTNASGKTTHVYSTGHMEVSNGLSNNGATFINDGYVKVAGNLANNPGGILDGNGGTWDVGNNAINAAGGFIRGTLNFCDQTSYLSCLNSCSTPACSTNCAINNTPFNGANSGTMDSTGISICGVRLVIPLSTGNILLQGIRYADNARLAWQSSSSSPGIQAYIIQRSTNGQTFENLTTQSTTESTLQEHEFTDNQLPGGPVYYRVRQEHSDGSHLLSNTVVLLDGQPSITLFPVPASGYVRVRAQGLKGKSLDLEVYSAIGQKVIAMALPISEGTQSLDYNLPLSLPNGSYYLRLIADNGEVASRFVVSVK